MIPKKVSKNTNYSTSRVTTGLVDEIKIALKNVKGWGSVEIFVQNGKVTQITERSIKKTDHDLHRDAAL